MADRYLKRVQPGIMCLLIEKYNTIQEVILPTPCLKKEKKKTQKQIQNLNLVKSLDLTSRLQEIKGGETFQMIPGDIVSKIHLYEDFYDKLLNVFNKLNVRNKIKEQGRT